MEKLDSMFEMQKALMLNYGYTGPVDIDTKEGQNKIREVMFFLTHELFEASEWMKMKPWRQTLVKTDIPAFMEEIADVMHFYLELCIYLGIDSHKLYEMYQNKVFKNIKRIEDKY